MGPTSRFSKPATWLVGFLLAILLAVGVLFYWDSIRRSQSAELPAEIPVAEKVENFETKLSDPKEFEEFCQQLRENYIEMDRRYRECTHRRTQHTADLDKNDTVIGEEEIIERVDFHNGEERRVVLSHRDLKTGKPTSSGSIQQVLNIGRTPYVYPFTKFAGPGDFTHTFEGMERIDGKTVAKIGFTPNQPYGRKVAGFVWIDPETVMPLRFWGRWFKPQPPVDVFELTFEYGLAENGHIQVRRVITKGAGGFAFINKRFRVTIDFDEYTPKKPAGDKSTSKEKS